MLLLLATTPKLNSYYRDFIVDPKIIIIHCCDFSHKSFKNEHPYALWNGMNVGAHYMITKDAQIIQCVPMTGAFNMFYMVRHAGPSNWKGMADIDHEKKWQTLNHKAIGIEIDSPGFVDPLNGDDIPGEYTKSQLVAAKWLVKHLQGRFNISSDCVLAHSDVSPYRVDTEEKVTLGKNDPSESFPWSQHLGRQRLSKNELVDKKTFLEKSLATIGYDLNRDGKVKPEQKHVAIKYCLLAFCRHWAPGHVRWCKTWDGIDCHIIPKSLLENIKYCLNIKKQ